MDSIVNLKKTYEALICKGKEMTKKYKNFKFRVKKDSAKYKKGMEYTVVSINPSENSVQLVFYMEDGGAMEQCVEFMTLSEFIDYAEVETETKSRFHGKTVESITGIGNKGSSNTDRAAILFQDGSTLEIGIGFTYADDVWMTFEEGKKQLKENEDEYNI